MELVPGSRQENYSVKVVKGPKSGKWTDQDIRYDENRLPSALQYHVNLTADAQNSGPNNQCRSKRYLREHQKRNDCI